MPRDPAVTSKIMAAVRPKDTVPEMILRRELHRRGLRYRVHTKLPGRPDVTFARARLVVFVDGDFWHGHGWRERGYESMEAQFDNHADPAKWKAKIARNVARDREVNQELAQLGWRIHRVLASEVLRDPSSAADGIERFVRLCASARSSG